MACNFSCFLNYSDALKENDIGVFKADNGEQYKVKYRSNICRDLLVKIEWTIPKQVLVTVKLYNTALKRCFSSKGLVVNGKKTFMKLRGAFNISNARDYKVLCIINLIPYIKFIKYNEILSEPIDSVLSKPESLNLSVDGSDAIINETTVSGIENVKECIDVSINSIVKNHDVNIATECEKSEPVKDSTYKECPPGVYDSALAHDVQMKEFNAVPSKNFTSCAIESDMPEFLTSEINLSACLKNPKQIKNKSIYETPRGLLKSGQVSGNELNTVESNAIERTEVYLLNQSEMIYYESMTSNHNSNEMGLLVENEPQNVTVKEESCTLEIVDGNDATNMYINIQKDLESKKIFEESHSIMEVDFTNSSVKNLESHDEANLSGKKHLKLADVFLENNVTSKINQPTEFSFHSLIERVDSLIENNSFSSRVDEMTTNTVDIEKESNGFSVTNNESLEKDLTNLLNCNSTCDENSAQFSMLIDMQSTPVGNISPTINLHRSSDDIDNEKIFNCVADKHKSDSLQLPPSKTDMVFKALVRKLSADDDHLEITDLRGESSNTENLNISIEHFFPVMESELKGLSLDMLDLLTSGDLADAVITNGIKHLNVHRAIVSGRSMVLKEVFTKHKQDDLKYHAFVHIPSYIFEDIIIFLYIGLIYIKSTRMANDVYHVAKRYCINDLIDISSKHISL